MIRFLLDNLLIENVYDFLIGKDEGIKQRIIDRLSQDDIMDLLQIALDKGY